MDRVFRIAALLFAVLPPLVGGVSAQGVDRVAPALLAEVMPAADRFDPAEGDPPVRRAYAGDDLVGFVFLTADLPPEEVGYSGPVRALVGVDLEGVLTGLRVTEYRESRRYEWGDFLGEPWFQGQFTGKHVGDRFAVGQDIDGIAQVTISVRALARGVRQAARRVALAHASPSSGSAIALSEAELGRLSWYEMRRRGVAPTLELRQQGRDPLDISVVRLTGDEMGQRLLGRRYESLVEGVERQGGADHVVLFVVAGGGFVPPLRQGWSVEQDGTVHPIPSERVVTIGTSGGLLADESSMVGALLLDDDQVDLTRPLTFAFDRGRPELGAARVEYTSQAALARMAAADVALPAPVPEAPPVPRAAAEVEAVPPADAAVAAAAPPETRAEAEPSPTPTLGPAPAAEIEPAAPVDVAALAEAEYEDAPGWAASSRVVWVSLVLVLALLAFLTKKEALRWVSLGTTLVVLGWVDGGFLSISHVTGLVWVGTSALRRDLPLLIMAAFTVVTLLLWGRVFCGYACPFGALQDFIDRLVPNRFKRELPKGAHRMALKVKYAVLALILLPALAGAQVSLYQYFEPFGTVFFLSRSALLWAIAGTILVAAAIVPRFYCRYACPLGALLAVGSVVSLRRVPRVEQCDYCKVCEYHCPTGAIDGPTLDFKECVRCNDCEVQLLQRRGVCRHDMEQIRPRLIRLERRRTAVAAQSGRLNT